MTTSTFKSVFKKLIGRNQKHKNWIPAEIQKIQISNSYVYRAVLSAVLYCTVLYCTGRLCFPAGSKPICSKRIICRDHNILAPIPKADHEALLPLKKIIETILWSRQINSPGANGFWSGRKTQFWWPSTGRPESWDRKNGDFQKNKIRIPPGIKTESVVLVTQIWSKT